MGQAFLTDLFTLCFVFGGTATVLSFVLGLGRHGPLHPPHHVGGALDHGVSAHPGASAAEISPFNLTSLLAFLVVFGAVGLALEDGIGGVLALLLAALAGLVAGWLVFLFLARFVLRGQTFLVDEPLAGTIGTVSAAIGPGRVGEIRYTRHGVYRSDGARSVDGQPIAAGEEVVILRYDNGIATVQRWHDYLASAPRPPRERSPDGRPKSGPEAGRRS